MKGIALFYVAIAVAFSSVVSAQTQTRVVVPFQLSEITLLPSPFKDAMDRTCSYLLWLDKNRMLYTFRTNYGLSTQGATPVAGWEAPGHGLRGHTMGHILTGLAQAYMLTGDNRYKAKADSLVTELRTCQNAAASRGWNTGYLSAWTEPKVDSLTCNCGLCPWAPLYCMHKTIAGMLDCYNLLGNSTALTVATAMGDWAYNKLRSYNQTTREAFWNNMCWNAGEYGGWNESCANLYAITANANHMTAAKYFDHARLFTPCLNNQDQLNGLHANTQVPKIIGSLRIFENTGELNYWTIPKNFWSQVINSHTYINGGNSNGEYFQAINAIAGQLSDRTCETCNIYNMLKLTRLLFFHDPQPAYMDYYERALYNQILASQNPISTVIPPDSISGRIGLGTWNTQARFDDVSVTGGATTLFSDNFSSVSGSWTERSGTWAVGSGYYTQSGTSTPALSVASSIARQSYTYTVRAMKTGGNEGFLVVFGWKDSSNYFWWNIGGWNNTTHQIEKCVGGTRSVVGTTVSGSLTTGQWYTISITVTGNNVKCYLDGVLIHDYTDNQGISLHGHSTYFQPMRAGGIKTYGSDVDSFRCCDGTALENHTKYQESIYFHSGDTLYVNLFIPSQLNWTAKGMTVRMETRYPNSDTVRLAVTGTGYMPVKIRVPSWLRRTMEVRINDALQPRINTYGTYVKYNTTWNGNGTIELIMPQSLRFERAPDNTNVGGAMFGSQLLAGRYGTNNLSSLPTLNAGTVAKVSTDTLLSFTATATPAANGLIPYYRMHGERYGVYWTLTNVPRDTFITAAIPEAGTVASIFYNTPVIKIMNSAIHIDFPDRFSEQLPIAVKLFSLKGALVIHLKGIVQAGGQHILLNAPDACAQNEVYICSITAGTRSSERVLINLH